MDALDQYAYWKNHSTAAVQVSDMFPMHHQKVAIAPERLDNDLREVSELITNYIPGSKGMKALELGAGIGRLSGLLATLFKEVVATDFVENYVAKNKEANQLLNITHQVVDPSRLDHANESIDVIFSNWLLMYFNDEDLKKFAIDVLRILQPGGFVVFRESHLYPGHDVTKADNDPATYRTLEEYHKAFVDAKYTSADKQDYLFEFTVGQSSQSCNDMTEIFWIWQKKKVGETPLRDLQLWSFCEEEEDGCSDSTAEPNHDHQSTSDGYNSYPEEGFGTPGGLPLLKRILGKVNVQPGSKVVEVGSGSGGAMKYIAKDLEASVTGVECSVSDVQKSIIALNTLGLTGENNVVIGDVKSVCLPENAYDLVCAREFFQCAPDKPEYCSQFLKWLKPGGQVLVAGFFIGKDCKEAHDFIKGFEWPPSCTAADLGKLLEKTGFVEVILENYTAQYTKIINEHLASFKGLSDSDKDMWEGFAKSFQEQFDKGIMTWSILIAKKPPA